MANRYENCVRRSVNACELAQKYPGELGPAGWEDPPYYLTAYGQAVKNGFRGSFREWRESLNGVHVTKIVFREV